MGSLRLRLSALWLVVGVLFAGGTAGADRSSVTEAAPRAEAAARPAETEKVPAEARALQPPPQPEAAPITRAPAAADGTSGSTGTRGVGAREPRRPGRTVSPEHLILLRSTGVALPTTF